MVVNRDMVCKVYYGKEENNKEESIFFAQCSLIATHCSLLATIGEEK